MYCHAFNGSQCRLEVTKQQSLVAHISPEQARWISQKRVAFQCVVNWLCDQKTPRCLLAHTVHTYNALQALQICAT